MITTIRALSLIERAVYNYLFQRPFCVSFEITHSCNAKCKHCHLGGHIEEQRASPEQFGQICRQINPLIAQFSGGEPLLRKDLEEIIKAVRRPNRSPYIDITTNGILLTPERYSSLLEAGVDQIGLSLDYPDSRHDVFRGVPGLFGRIEKFVQSLNGEKDKAITLLCVVQRDNFRDMLRMAELAYDWKVKINFSAYTWLRTHDENYLLTPPEVEELRQMIPKLLKFKQQHHNIFTSPYVFKKMAQFFEHRSLPPCQTGVKFFNVNPDGSMSPCGLIIKDYRSQQALREKFSRHNTCTYCYTSIRANTEKPLYHLIADNLQVLNRF